MKNWMEKYERSKDEQRERDLNYKLKKLLELIDESYKDEEMLEVLNEIIEVYDELKREACDYDEKDYIARKKQLAEIRYALVKQEEIKRYENMEKEYKASKESQSWNEYKDEEQIEDREYDEER